MKGKNLIFYTPENQYPGMPHGEMCGDIMPFYLNGTYHLVFLYKYCIYAVETKDFVHYGKLRLVLQNGTPQEQDWHAATGSICAHNGVFYFYYTGFCEGNRGEEGKYEQAILRAVSRDLYVWEKDRDYFFAPDEAHYGPRHWRDPHVFWNEELGKYCMLVTAMEKGGAANRNGCTAVYVSEDLSDWVYDRTIYSPGTYPSHECQDAFRMGDRWYLTFSTYSRQWETRYRTAESFYGPWKLPEGGDCLEGRDFYAAKTVTDGEKRYLVGWQSIKKDCRNDGKCVWGGNVVVHELIQKSGGALGVKLPDTIRSSFTREKPVAGQEVRCSRADGFAWARLGQIEGMCLFETRLTWEPGTAAAGLMFHVNGEHMEIWYQLRLEPERRRILLDRWDRTDGDQSYEEERPLTFTDNTAVVRLITDQNVVLIYVDTVALSARSYDVSAGAVGVFAEYGTVQASEIRLLGQPEAEEENR